MQSMVEGVLRKRMRPFPKPPSTTLRAVPLPVPGRISPHPNRLDSR
jgi:hypothetical protein